MSIYGTWLSLDGDDHDVESCDAYYEASEDTWELTGKPCSCDAWKRQPIVYEGSHVLPSDEDRRGGSVEVAAIPNHVDRPDRPELPDGVRKDWLRLCMQNVASSEQYEGKPYVSAGDAAVVLPRPLVQELRDTLTAWLEREGDEAVREGC